MTDQATNRDRDKIEKHTGSTDPTLTNKSMKKKKRGRQQQQQQQHTHTHRRSYSFLSTLFHNHDGYDSTLNWKIVPYGTSQSFIRKSDVDVTVKITITITINDNDDNINIDIKMNIDQEYIMKRSNNSSNNNNREHRTQDNNDIRYIIHGITVTWEVGLGCSVESSYSVLSAVTAAVPLRTNHTANQSSWISCEIQAVPGASSSSSSSQ